MLSEAPGASQGKAMPVAEAVDHLSAELMGLLKQTKAIYWGNHMKQYPNYR